MIPTRLSVAVTLAALVSTAHADTPVDYRPPAEPPALLPTKIGQYVSYRRKTKTEESIVGVRVLGEDSCGVWVEVDSDKKSGRELWRTCVARAPQGTFTVKPDGGLIEYRDGHIARIDTDGDPARAALLARLLRAEWVGKKGLPREDTITVGGTTILAVKETAVEGNAARTRWSHPAVPAGGLVREVDGDDELLLLEQGERTSNVIFDDSMKLYSQAKAMDLQERPRKKIMGFMFGSDLLGTVDKATWTEAFGFSVGYRPRLKFAVLLGSAQTGLAPHPTIPELAERLLQVTLGARWYPYASPQPTSRWQFLFQGVYLQGDLGYAQLMRGRLLMETGTAGRGGVAGLRLGLTTGIVKDWRLVMELHEHTALLNSDEGTRITLGLYAGVELYLP